MFSTAKYLLREGLKNIWINGVMSIASILVMVCCMILTGSAMLFSMNLRSTIKTIESQNCISVYMKSDATDAEIKTVEEKLKKISNINFCEYCSKDEIAEKCKDMFDDDIVDLLGKNPFPSSFNITMNNLSQYNSTVKQIEEIADVESVGNRSETAKKLTDLSNLVATAGIWVISLLGLVSLFIISNTIKITMYSRRFEIGIMKSVGATNWFIRMPFIVEGVIIGLLAGIISTVLLNIGYSSMIKIINDIIPFSVISLKNISWKIFGIFSTVGVIFGTIGGIISISKYLRKEGVEIVW